MSGRFADLDALSYPQVGELLAREVAKIALLPVGSVEAHGPHLPLATDTIISAEVARRAGLALAERGLVALRAPAIAYGVTDWARGFAGTTSLPASTIADVVFSTARALVEIGFDRVVVTNAHLEPAHISTLRSVVARAGIELGGKLVFSDKTRRKNAAELGGEFASGSCHAGRYETSLVLAIRPELVDMAAARALPEHVVPLHERIAAGAQDFAACGLDRAYCGAPAEASAAEGEATLVILARQTVDATLASLGLA